MGSSLRLSDEIVYPARRRARPAKRRLIAVRDGNRGDQPGGTSVRGMLVVVGREMHGDLAAEPEPGGQAEVVPAPEAARSYQSGRRQLGSSPMAW